MQHILIAALSAMLLLGAGQVQAKVEMTDSQLEQVIAGVSVTSTLSENKTVSFEFRKDSLAGTITGSGNASLDVQPLPGTSGGTINLVNSTATQNGLVNVIAVNSIINALLNLNVNINSNVSHIQQSNTTGSLQRATGIGTVR